MGNEITKEEYEILGFLLDFISEGETDYLVLQNETENDFVTGNVDLFQKQQEELKGLPAGLMLDFVTKNMKSYPLDAALLQTERKILLQSPEELEKAFVFDGTTDGWASFYKKYPESDGQTVVSRAGFNEQKTEALVYIAGIHDILCAEGNLYYLKKADSKWQLSDIIPLWIS